MQTVLALARDGAGIDLGTLAVAPGASGASAEGPRAAGGRGAAEVCEAVLAAVGFLPPEEQAWIDVDVPAGVVVGMEDVALQHVVMNLLINARRASPRDRVSVGLETSDNVYTLVVADRGPGMPTWAKARLAGTWEAAGVTSPYAKGATSASAGVGGMGQGAAVGGSSAVPQSRPAPGAMAGASKAKKVSRPKSRAGSQLASGGGTPGLETSDSPRGLGLFICARLMGASKGSIHAEDRVGGGTVVRVTLPAVARRQAA
jgi:hypothetical protein